MIINLNQVFSVYALMSSEDTLIYTSGEDEINEEVVENSAEGMSSVQGSNAKDPLLSNWTFVIGVSFLSLAVSIIIGTLLAKRIIKKGIEQYKD